MSNDTNIFTEARTDPKLLILVYVLSDPLQASSCQCGLSGQRCTKENLCPVTIAGENRSKGQDQWFIARLSVDF